MWRNKNILFFGECSAKSNLNVLEPIAKLVEAIYDKQMSLIQEGKKKEKELKVAPEIRHRKELQSSCTIF